MNVRGRPTVAYQVLPEVGYPPIRVPPWPGPRGGGYLRWGTPWAGLMGGPKVGYPPVRVPHGHV